MDSDRARFLLENLLERAEPGEKVVLTSREVEALAVLLGRADESPLPARAPAAADPLPELAVVTVADSEIEQDVMLCVDFGTSFSKAFVCVGDANSEPLLIDLPIGDEKPLITPSELFIDGDQLYFGPAARRRWNDIHADADRLIDSIKQYITLNADVSALGERPMPPTQDPQGRFTQRDVLVLYLAHLMALTERTLEAKGLPANIRRRFTHPAWGGKVQKQNEEAMRRLMAEAIVLARSGPQEFLASIPINTARRLLDALHLVDSANLPVNLVAEPVREATAAGAGALRATREGERDAYLIVDIGAGTTDVAGFYCVNNPNHDRARVFEVSSAANAKNLAGNALDNALNRFIMEKSGLARDSTEYRLAAAELRRNLRANKEQLFDTGAVVVELATHHIVEISLDDFLGYEPVTKINQQIKAMVAASAEALVGDGDRLKLVATGGGANLPLIAQLAAEGVTCSDRTIRLELADAIDDHIRENHPDLVDPFPQIAVALGGSLPDLPEQRASVSTGLTTTPPRTLEPLYRS